MCPTDLQSPVTIGYSVARDGDRFAVKEFAFLGDRMAVRIVETLPSLDPALLRARGLARTSKTAFIGLEKELACAGS
jgi:hypothetical protein